jgi:hypothetical protein
MANASRRSVIPRPEGIVRIWIKEVRNLSAKVQIHTTFIIPHIHNVLLI